MANLIIPCAGVGSRFVQVGQTIPKPFIPIKGKTMIEWVIENLTTENDCIYLVMRSEHISYLASTSLVYKNNIAIIPIQQPTEGAACTVLKVKTFINNNEPLIIANCDQWVRYNKFDWEHELKNKENDGLIMTFSANSTKWSFSRVDNYKVVEVAEKQVISKNANVGVFAFKSGCEFVTAAEKMIAKDIRVNNEFYVAPVINELVADKNFRIFPVNAMFGLGDPTSLESNYDEVGI